MDKMVALTGFLVFFGMFLTNLGLVGGINFIFMNMLKSSKCLNVILLTWLFPTKGNGNMIRLDNVLVGLVITAGLIMFNGKVNILWLTYVGNLRWSKTRISNVFYYLCVLRSIL